MLYHWIKNVLGDYCVSLTYRSEVGEADTSWAQFRKSLLCWLTMLFLHQPGLVWQFRLEGTSGSSCPGSCTKQSGLRPGDIAQGLNPDWFWKPPRKETIQPLKYDWAPVRPGSKPLLFQLMPGSVFWWRPYRYWRMLFNSLSPLHQAEQVHCWLKQLTLYQDPQGLFSRAAQQLGISGQTIGKHVKKL